MSFSLWQDGLAADAASAPGALSRLTCGGQCPPPSSSSGRASSPRTPASCARPCSRASATRSRRCTRAGVDVVIVTSGAIARGMRLLELPVRPRAIEELQAASAVGQGKLYRIYDELLRERGMTSRAGAADVLRHERAHALPQRAPDAAQAARLARSCRSSTRTTRRRPTRSPSATTTSSPRRSRCWSAPSCWSC